MVLLNRRKAKKLLCVVQNSFCIAKQYISKILIPVERAFFKYIDEP